MAVDKNELSVGARPEEMSPKYSIEVGSLLIIQNICDLRRGELVTIKALFANFSATYLSNVKLYLSVQRPYAMTTNNSL